MQYTFPASETIQMRAWTKPHLPQKVLFIRLHAFGDLLAAMPAAQHLKELNPRVEMHLLTCAPYADLPRNMLAFNKVHTIEHSIRGWKMGLDLLLLYPKLLVERFDAVLDLQNNVFSRALRRALFPTAWCQFDRFSKIHVVRRYQHTVNAIGLGDTRIGQKIALRDESTGIEKLRENGWNGHERLIVLNPCGLFANRQWGVEQYLAFAKRWLAQVDRDARFVLLGLPAMQGRVALLNSQLESHCINLIGKTTLLEMFNIVRRADLTLSDDGGLMHASWINHVPTIGFLGASPSYWGIPLGEKSFGFTSSDLPCGDCHRSDCIWGDNRCLTRVTPEMALEKAKELLEL